ncbi:uncharacterized protein LOC142777199 isoform X1 [Rhipicephalus microplus]|uniref:uncharacterized protein LOC142777199 isoform X1 n=1 Tax=Rhipicephalus microplus TaxID=6941 RepID=UPI003F6B950D
MSSTNVSRQPSKVSVTGSGSSSSRIEVSTMQVNEEEQGGNLKITGGGQFNIRTTISKEGTNHEIIDQTGQETCWFVDPVNASADTPLPPTRSHQRHNFEGFDSCVVCDTIDIVTNVSLPGSWPPKGAKGKFEKRVIIDNGIETIEEYENDKLVRRLVNGVEEPVSK